MILLSFLRQTNLKCCVCYRKSGIQDPSCFQSVISGWTQSVLKVFIQRSSFVSWNVKPSLKESVYCSYRFWWWLVQRWLQRSQMPLVVNRNSLLLPVCAVAHKSANHNHQSSVLFFPETRIHKPTMEIFTLTGMSMMQSSARQSFVTQCRNTVDIFWCLCFTKRKTSKEKRPIWLFPFSKTVVWGSL